LCAFFILLLSRYLIINYLILCSVEELVAKFVSFHFENERLVTAWISGAESWFNMSGTFNSFLSHVEDKFSIVKPRAYVLQSPEFKWLDRIRLTVENFSDFQNKTGMFSTMCKLYVCADDSPAHSPGHSPDRKVGDGDDDGSQGTHRSGQTEFNASLYQRDEGKCVFCGSIDNLEAAHILPLHLKNLLLEPENRTHYRIDTINDGCNGITLCWPCHKCFDVNLLCIDPMSGKLLISDALLANEGDKFTPLVGATVSPRFSQWPTELLQYRVSAMETSTEDRHGKQDAYELFCSRCQKGYKRLAYLQKHEVTCIRRLTPAMYYIPAGKSSAF
jgi:hypothetical protein